MIGKLIRNQLKSWLILITVFSAVMFLVYISASAQVTYVVNNDAYNYLGSSYNAFQYAPILYPAIFALIASCVFPILAFSYRFTTSRADTYLALPMKKGLFRNVRLIVGLCAILAPFTLTYWFGFGIQALIHASSQAPSGGSVVPMHFVYYVPAYFFLVLGIACSYAVNAFLAGQATNVGAAIVNVLAGQAALGLSLACVGVSINAFLTMISSDGVTDVGWLYDLIYLNPSAIGIGIATNGIFASLAFKGSVHLEGTKLVFLLVGLGLNLVLGGLSVLYFLKKADPSGEYAGKAGPITVGNTVPYHFAAFGILMIIMTGLGSVSRLLIFVSIMELGVCAAAYFFLRALLRKRLAPAKVDLITIICVLAVCLTWVILLGALVKY